jgi:hypothetical protein
LCVLRPVLVYALRLGIFPALVLVRLAHFLSSPRRLCIETDLTEEAEERLSI